MKKTNTKTKTSSKKSTLPSSTPAVKKAPVAKKTSVKAAPKKSIGTTTISLLKTTTPIKKVSTQKAAPKISSDEKINTLFSSSAKNDSKEGVKLLGILHLVGNIVSGGLLGIILVIAYLLIRKDELSQLEKDTCYEIINFNISFIIYAFISACLMIVLIGFVLLPIVAVT